MVWQPSEEEIKKIRETLDALLPNKTWAVLFWEEKKPGAIYIRQIALSKSCILG